VINDKSPQRTLTPQYSNYPYGSRSWLLLHTGFCSLPLFGYGGRIRTAHSLSSCEYNVEKFVKARFARGAETRLPMIRTAADLFHKGLGLPAPMKSLRLRERGRGSSYHYFRNKEGLIHEVLQTYLDEIKAGVSRVNYEINSWKDLQKWFASQVELQKDYEMTRGYPLGTLGIEVTDNDELVRQDLSLIFEVVKNKLAAFFVREKAKGRLAKQADPEQIADFCIASMQGAMLMGKVKRSSQTVEATVQEALAHLKSYLAKN
jgi:TetR/AcrR family transcriptional regulator, transcriptional repressor for nem operon